MISIGSAALAMGNLSRPSKSRPFVLSGTQAARDALAPLSSGRADTVDWVHVPGLRFADLAALLSAIEGLDGQAALLAVDTGSHNGGDTPFLQAAAKDLAGILHERRVRPAFLLIGQDDNSAPSALEDVVRNLASEHDIKVHQARGSLDVEAIEEMLAGAEAPRRLQDSASYALFCSPEFAAGAAATLSFRIHAPARITGVLLRCTEEQPDLRLEAGGAAPIIVPVKAAGEGVMLQPLELDCRGEVTIAAAATGKAVDVMALLGRHLTQARPATAGLQALPSHPPMANLDLGAAAYGDLASFDLDAPGYQATDGWSRQIMAMIADRALVLRRGEIDKVRPGADAICTWFSAAVEETAAKRLVAGEPLEWICPLTGESAIVRGGLPHRFGTLMFARLEREFVSIAMDGPAFVGCYYHVANIFIFNKNRSDDWRLKIMRTMINELAPKPRNRRYVEACFAGEQADALIVGDRRPSHYLSQNLNALAQLSEADVAALAQRGCRLVVIKDWCFLDARELLPALQALPSIETTSEDLTATVRNARYRGVRLVRAGNRSDFSTLSRATVADAGYSEDPGVLRLWISLDAERRRVRNQVDMFVQVLRALGRWADARGRRLAIGWDGWTLGSAEPTERDVRVIASIREMAAEIVAQSGVDMEEAELFNGDLLGKVRSGTGADLAFATYGTACIAPNLIAGVPLVAYHVPRAVAQGGFADEDNSLIIDEAGIEPVGRLDEGSHLHEFVVAPEAVVAAAVTLLERPEMRSAAAGASPIIAEMSDV